ncbi:MAG: serine O-acetyltransferase [Clostridiales bacterium]|nr:serine O-acetyltransferase [Clostridiales bacterium]
MKIVKDIKAVLERDPAARNAFEVLCCYPSIHAIIWYRIAHVFHKIKLKFIARLMSQTTRFFTGIEIHPGATIGTGFFIDHGMGTVIGETCEIGNNVTLYQNVTLGGTGKDHGKRHPTIGNDVLIGAGAKILGPFKVGDGAKVGAGAVVLNEVPAWCTVVGNPGRMVRCFGQKTEVPEAKMDQIHLPDPIKNELELMHEQISHIQKQLNKMSKEQ